MKKGQPIAHQYCRLFFASQRKFGIADTDGKKGPPLRHPFCEAESDQVDSAASVLFELESGIRVYVLRCANLAENLVLPLRK
jgi:hypothetical protein